VLAAIPQCYRNTPAAVRWHIGAAVKAQLARGWTEDQIIAILAAALPDEVRKPLVLARWRFAKNMLGAGPRLRPAQRAWDRANDAAEHARWAYRHNRDYAAVIADAGTEVAARMAETARWITAGAPGGQAHPVTAEQHHAVKQAATITAARMARREHPNQPLTTAVSAWLAAHGPVPAPVEATSTAVDRELTIADLIATTPAGRCVRCRSVGAITREDLPIPAPVCEDCWCEIAGEDACSHDSDPTAAAAGPSVETCGRREAC